MQQEENRAELDQVLLQLLLFLCRRCRLCSSEITGRWRNARTCARCAEALQKSRRKASRHLKRAIRKGILAPITKDTRCVDCNGRARQYDHRDYNKPLEVEPVCGACNLTWAVGAPLPDRASCSALRYCALLVPFRLRVPWNSARRA